jgi:hypothetical protein
LLLSFIYANGDELQTDLFPGDVPGFDIEDLSQSYQAESQYIYEKQWFNLVAGLGYTDEREDIQFPSSLLIIQTNHLHPYVYTNLKFPSPVTWTLGVAYDDFEQDPVFVDRVSPKLGVRWDVTPNLSLRGAVFRWVKPALAANRTLEPTQVAGFDQVYDDGDGDESLRRGAGLDWRVTKSVFFGGEATWRDILLPVITGENSAIFENAKEQLHRAYFFWTPASKLSLSGQVEYDFFEAETGLLTSDRTPTKVKTVSVPLAARYFARNGFIAGVGVTYVDQEVVRTPDARALGFLDGRENFVVVDASVGWRFPKRMGIASLTVNNLLNEKFRFQDDSFREFRNEPSTGPYIPDRRLVGRASLYF